ncbi:glycine cleavage system H protein [Caldisphaera lagunensis DSM 15908]|uniref:Probable glycine cleavage system H protein n=1 Tax=Caldisphaera lagunensis (strain DSM 15908 / JCM 11604 / ANMR 0165 / IC-154) TaxID=1056495 RepID=L0A9Y0_CALLD|nr:glycine cleavage system protein GcvH [Caldisphaera lagunensis]AFZ70703.1 glycine cleavage system H protein [Caldisphaera lagunensis DSM 15908]
MSRYQVKVGNQNVIIDDSLLYTKSDEWVKFEGDKIRIGITDYAQKQLKDIVGVDLPKKGSNINKNGTLAVLESVKATAEVYSPIEGKVLDVNERLLDEPELINKEPYDNGWIALIEAKSIDKNEFLDHKSYVDDIAKRK